MTELVQRLNVAKRNKGYTLQQLSQQTGISLGTINKIMSGALQSVKQDKLAKLAKALDVSTQWLTSGREQKPTTNQQFLGLVNIACISPKVSVANVQFNAQQIVDATVKANKNGVNVAVFPELCLTGYSCGDLFFQQTLQQQALTALQQIAQTLASVSTVVLVGLPFCGNSGKLYNVGAVVFGGKILGIVPKMHLPNYNEFAEKRQFATYQGENTTVTVGDEQVPFGNKLIFVDSLHPIVKFGVEICEDVWVSQSPSVSHALAGANAVFNLSASDESVVKADYRKKMIEIQSGKNCLIYGYACSHMSESTSQVVFSAHNIICENAQVIAESKPFGKGYASAWADFDFISNERAKMDKEQTPSGYQYVNFSLPLGGGKRVYSATPFVPTNADERNKVCQRAMEILSYGLVKRIEHVACDKLVLGVSGGSDSTLSLLVCCKALQLLNRPTSDVVAVTMPCFGTSQRTLNNSVALAEQLGCTLKVIDVTKSVTQHLTDIGHDLTTADVTLENAQARERTQVLMDVANSINGLLVGTGDMSECALGWSTYNGDHMSMYNVNSAVSKTFVRALIAYNAQSANASVRKVLQDVLDTPVSPELLPQNKDSNQMRQVTEDIVGPYVLHDYFLFMLVRKGFCPSKVYLLAQQSFDGVYDAPTIEKWLRKFIWRFFTQQFKRSCAPDGVRLGSVDISKMGWRMPSDASCASWIADLDSVTK